MRWTPAELGQASVNELISFLEEVDGEGSVIEYDQGIVLVAQGRLAQRVMAFLNQRHGLVTLRVSPTGVEAPDA